MAKDVLYVIIAYIRTLPSGDSTVTPGQLAIPMPALSPLPEFALEKSIRPEPLDKMKYGQYIATIASCGNCCTPMNKDGSPDFSKVFSGGIVFSTPILKVAVANITADSTSGVGPWTEEAFVGKFRTNSSDEVVNRDHG